MYIICFSQVVRAVIYGAAFGFTNFICDVNQLWEHSYDVNESQGTMVMIWKRAW
jgi:hypothetical protein